MAQYRNYSDEDKATALAFYDACQNLKMAARECQVPEATLRLWRDNRDAPSAPSAESVTEKREAIADRLEHICHLLIDSIPGKIEDAPLSATMVGVGIAIDKKRLEREQATSISSTVQSEEQRDEKVLEILRRGKLRVVNGGEA